MSISNTINFLFAYRMELQLKVDAELNEVKIPLSVELPTVALPITS